jgi:(4S)-4-hydroxy-5-phosphonooxypentane-2,3-dione isomerase
MFVVTASIHVKPEHIARFIEALLDDAHGALRDEPGCRRFDVIQDAQDASRFLLYEVYDDEAAFQHHLTTAHFQRSSPIIEDCLAEPLQPQIGREVFMTENAHE